MALRVDGEDDFEQVARIQAEDGAAIRPNVADSFQRGLDFRHGVEIGRADDVMNLARLAVTLVDVADFAGQEKAHRRLAGRRR